MQLKILTEYTEWARYLINKVWMERVHTCPQAWPSQPVCSSFKRERAQTLSSQDSSSHNKQLIFHCACLCGLELCWWSWQRDNERFISDGTQVWCTSKVRALAKTFESTLDINITGFGKRCPYGAGITDVAPPREVPVAHRTVWDWNSINWTFVDNYWELIIVMRLHIVYRIFSTAGHTRLLGTA